jgi:hypothetical protein
MMDSTDMPDKRSGISSKSTLLYIAISVLVICIIIIAGAAFFLSYRNPMGMWESSTPVEIPEPSTMGFNVLLSPDYSFNGTMFLYRTGTKDREVYTWGEMSGQWERRNHATVAMSVEKSISHHYSADGDCSTNQSVGPLNMIFVYDFFTDHLVLVSPLGETLKPITFHRVMSFDYQTMPGCIAYQSPCVGTWQAQGTGYTEPNTSLLTMVMNPDASISIVESVNVTSGGGILPVITKEGNGTWEKNRESGNIKVIFIENYNYFCKSLEDYQQNRCEREVAAPTEVTFIYEPEVDEMYPESDPTIRFHRIQ